MSTSSAVGLLYAASVAAPAAASPRPDDEVTSGRKHHNAKGLFENPWPSWREMHSVFHAVSANSG